MPDSVEELLAQVVEAPTWDARIAAIRQVPQLFGIALHREAYAQIAAKVYVPALAPDFAFVHWARDYELDTFDQAYAFAHELTDGFARISVDDLTRAIREEPSTLLVFRTIVGYITRDFAKCTRLLPDELDLPAVGKGMIESIEGGIRPTHRRARACAEVVDRLLHGTMFPEHGDPDTPLRGKHVKPDTEHGWTTVQRFAADRVPYSVFLHQRHYGGAFRQVLDATSAQRGDVLEDPVEDLFADHGVPYIRTGSHNQDDIERRFNLRVTPAPDFVIHDGRGGLRAMLECKGANDGGTARDKAGRFRNLRQEGMRLGGVPVLAVLGGLGWERVGDALGVVVAATDGRVFTPVTLSELLEIEPISVLVSPS